MFQVAALLTTFIRTSYIFWYASSDLLHLLSNCASNYLEYECYFKGIYTNKSILLDD